MLRVGKAEYISRCLEFAILLEVSTNKPGNVNFVVGFEGTRVEHFLASAVVSAPSFKKAAERGIAVSEGRLLLQEVGVGNIIEHCIRDIASWQKGGNTLLGTIMLFVPLAVAAGMTSIKQNEKLDIEKLRKNLEAVVRETTAEDAIHVYNAIDVAKPSGLNSAPILDVNDRGSKKKLLDEGFTLFDVFEIAAGYDDICFEWVNNFPITFDLAFPYIKEQLKTKSMSGATVQTFLKVLSERPDTFIARKIGRTKALRVSKYASRVLALGGVETLEGRRGIVKFDKKLRNSGNDYNPGTTADIIAATLALCIFDGYRS